MTLIWASAQVDRFEGDEQRQAERGVAAEGDDREPDARVVGHLAEQREGEERGHVPPERRAGQEGRHPLGRRRRGPRARRRASRPTAVQSSCWERNFRSAGSIPQTQPSAARPRARIVKVESRDRRSAHSASSATGRRCEGGEPASPTPLAGAGREQRRGARPRPEAVA